MYRGPRVELHPGVARAQGIALPPGELRWLSHVSLAPEHVLAIVWWSKNYAVYRRFADQFNQFPVQYFQFTINPRDEDLSWLEPDIPPLAEVLGQVEFLAARPGGPELISWRYDPLVFWSEGGVERSSWRPAFFEQMCRELSQIGVRRCVTSLADPYARFRQRLVRYFPEKRLREPAPAELDELTGQMAACAATYGMKLEACTEGRLAQSDGFAAARCIDGNCLAPRAGTTWPPATDVKVKGREECGCTLHTDVGDYQAQECGYGCVYCYAYPNHRRFESLGFPD